MSDLLQLIDAVLKTVQAGLDAADLAPLANLGALPEPRGCFEILKHVDSTEASLQMIRSLDRAVRRLQVSVSETAVERVLLLRCGQHSLPHLYEMRLGAAIKEQICREFEFFAKPSDRWRTHFRAGDVRYKEMAKIATFRRFPAGQMHWEITGLERSLPFRLPFRSIPTYFRAVAKMGGFSPVWEMHVNDRRKNPLVLLESESHRTYCRTAQSLELQPEIRGVVTGGWFYDPAIAVVTPHLAWMAGNLAAGGATMIDLGELRDAQPAVTRSQHRKELYDHGKYRPRRFLAVWARKDLIVWAHNRPEYAQEDL